MATGADAAACRSRGDARNSENKKYKLNDSDFVFYLLPPSASAFARRCPDSDVANCEAMLQNMQRRLYSAAK